MRRVEGGKWRERAVGKAAGDERVFIPGPRVGLADEAGSDAMPDAAGGEGGHGPLHQMWQFTGTQIATRITSNHKCIGKLRRMLPGQP